MGSMKTFVLLFALTLLLIFAGRVIGGQVGAIYAFIFAMILNFGSYWFSDKIVLSMYRAVEVGEREAPKLHRIVSRLTQQAGMPLPKLYIIPTSTPNAFATGRDPNHAAVAVTDGILKMLDDRELAGVLSHELAHIKNRDTLLQTIAASIAGAITLLASFARWGAIFGGFGRRDEEDSGILGLLALAILAPLAAMLIQLAISRSREYLADKRGAEISQSPLDLASALIKLSEGVNRIPMRANPATSHLFIVNPLSGGFMATLFSTHPPIEDRVRKLRELAGIR
jgi:heat shock protein HtpX